MTNLAVQRASKALHQYFIKDKIFGNKCTAIAIPLIVILSLGVTCGVLHLSQLSMKKIILCGMVPIIASAAISSILKVFFKETKRQCSDLISSRSEFIRNFFKNFRPHHQKELAVSTMCLLATICILGIGIGGLPSSSHLHSFFNKTVDTYKILLGMGVPLILSSCIFTLGANSKNLQKIVKVALQKITNFCAKKQPSGEVDLLDPRDSSSDDKRTSSLNTGSIPPSNEDYTKTDL